MEDIITQLIQLYKGSWPKVYETVFRRENYEDISEGIDWLEDAIKYNVNKGKGIRLEGKSL